MTKEQLDILEHTNRANRAGEPYCGGGPEMDSLVDKGLMVCVGKESFVPDLYYQITAAGKEALQGGKAQTQ